MNGFKVQPPAPNEALASESSCILDINGVLIQYIFLLMRCESMIFTWSEDMPIYLAWTSKSVHTQDWLAGLGQSWIFSTSKDQFWWRGGSGETLRRCLALYLIKNNAIDVALTFIFFQVNSQHDWVLGCFLTGRKIISLVALSHGCQYTISTNYIKKMQVEVSYLLWHLPFFQGQHALAAWERLGQVYKIYPYINQVIYIPFQKDMIYLVSITI